MLITKKNIAVFAKDESLSSYEFWKVLNQIRKDRGASHVEHGKFLTKVKDELDDLPQSTICRVEKSNREIEVYQLNKDQMMLVGMRESKVIRKQVLKWLKELSARVDSLEQQKADRTEASLSFKEQSTALKSIRQLKGKETLSFHYSNEANMINRLILGCTAKAYREDNGFDASVSLRDTLTQVEIEAFTALRKSNEAFINAGIEFEDRKNMLKSQLKLSFNQRLIDEVHLLN